MKPLPAPVRGNTDAERMSNASPSRNHRIEGRSSEEGSSTLEETREEASKQVFPTGMISFTQEMGSSFGPIHQCNIPRTTRTPPGWISNYAVLPSGEVVG